MTILAQIAEGSMAEAELYMSLTKGGNSHTQSILYGGGPALTNSSGVPWTAAYIDSRGDPTCDLRSNIAAESRAKIVYERLINLTDDPGIKDALGFLMTREIAHQKSFEKALYAIADNFPPGKLPGLKTFADTYVNTSQGGAEPRGPWNSGQQWDRVDELEEGLPADGGDGEATVQLSSIDMTTLNALAARTMSQQEGDPKTGADLGAGPGAGKVTGEDKGGAGDMDEARTMAQKRSAA